MVVRVCGGYLGRIADILREVLVEGEEYRINSSFGRVVPLRSYRLKVCRDKEYFGEVLVKGDIVGWSI